MTRIFVGDPMPDLATCGHNPMHFECWRAKHRHIPLLCKRPVQPLEAQFAARRPVSLLLFTGPPPTLLENPLSLLLSGGATHLLVYLKAGDRCPKFERLFSFCSSSARGHMPDRAPLFAKPLARGSGTLCTCRLRYQLLMRSIMAVRTGARPNRGADQLCHRLPAARSGYRVSPQATPGRQAAGNCRGERPRRRQIHLVRLLCGHSIRPCRCGGADL